MAKHIAAVSRGARAKVTLVPMATAGLMASLIACSQSDAGGAKTPAAITTGASVIASQATTPAPPRSKVTSTPTVVPVDPGVVQSSLPLTEPVKATGPCSSPGLDIINMNTRDLANGIDAGEVATAMMSVREMGFASHNPACFAKVETASLAATDAASSHPEIAQNINVNADREPTTNGDDTYTVFFRCNSDNLDTVHYTATMTWRPTSTWQFLTLSEN